MTRFELVIKSFADPWLRPLTHTALKKHPGILEDKMHTHTQVPTRLHNRCPDAGEILRHIHKLRR